MEGQQSSFDLSEFKASLGAQILDSLSHRGYTQSRWAKIVGVRQSEVSALKRGDTSRFSVERLLRLLLDLRHDISIEIATAGTGRIRLSKRPRTIGELQMRDILELLGANRNGLVIVAGAPHSGRTTVLHSLLSADQGGTVQLFSNAEAHPTITTIRFETDDQIHHRALPSADVMGIDLVSKTAASPYTALHYARDSRVYAVIEASDAKRALDQFMSYMGPPAMGAQFVVPSLLGIVTTRLGIDAEGNRLSIDWELSKVEVDSECASDYRVSVVKAFKHVPKTPAVFDGPLQSTIHAKAFLDQLSRELADDFRTSLADEDALELEVSNIRSGREMTISLAKDRNKHRYDAYITTEEPWREVRDGEAAPETRLFGAPADIGVIAGIARRFLAGGP